MKALAITVVLALMMTALAVVLSPPPAAGATNPNPVLSLRITAIQDTYIDINFPTTNFCKNATLLTRATPSRSTTAAGLFKFSLSSLPSNAQVLSSTFYEYFTGVQINKSQSKTNPWDAPFAISYATSSWSECTVTWNNGGAFVGVSPNVLTQMVNNWTATYPQPFGFDITTITGQWFSGATTNNGLVSFFNDACNSAACPDEYAILSTQNATFSRPYVVIQYQLPTAYVYPSYFCLSGPCALGTFTGDGIDPYIFQVFAAENNGTFRRVLSNYIATNVSTYLSIQVKDFFGNTLVTQSFMVVNYISFPNIGIPYRLFKVQNLRDQITTVSLNPSGGTPMVMDLLSKEIWSAGLKSGINYWFNFSEKDINNNVIGTISLQRTMSQATTYIVNGTTLEEVITDLNGLSTTIQNQAFVAPVGVTGTNLPFVPLNRISPGVVPALISNYPVQAVQYNARKNGTGTPIGLWRPYDKTLPAAQVSVLSDQIWFSGTWTKIYLNDTKDTATTTDDTILCQFSATFGTLTQCPSGTNLAGQNISVVTLTPSNVRADRLTTVLIFKNFNWSYNAASNAYQSQVSVADTSPLPWTGLSAYFAFPAGVTPNPSTVAVVDLDNGNIQLVAGSQFSSDYKGVYMGLTSLAAAATRHFQISFTAQNTTTYQVVSLVATSAAPDSSFPPAAYKAVVQASQQTGQNFAGDIVIQFNIQDPSFQNRLVDMSTLVVVNGNTGVRIVNWYPHPTQPNVIVIPQVAIPGGTVQTYNLYFAYTSAAAGNLLGLNANGWAILFLVALVFMVIFGVSAAAARARVRKELR